MTQELQHKIYLRAYVVVIHAAEKQYILHWQIQCLLGSSGCPLFQPPILNDRISRVLRVFWIFALLFWGLV